MNIETQYGSIFPEGIFKSVRTPEITNTSAIPIPDFLAEKIRGKPAIVAILSEMASTDPATFLHQIMAAESYRILRRDYIKKIAASTPVRILRQINSFLSAHDTVALFHDAGKWGINRDVDISTQIVNKNYQPEGNGNGNNHTSRPADEKKQHMLHPITGSYMLSSLLAILGINDDQSRIYGDIIARHHNYPQATVWMYPDGNIRKIHHELNNFDFSEKKLTNLAAFLIHLSDTISATGQPRAYRNQRHTDEHILLKIDSRITKESLEKIFGEMDEAHAIKVKKSVIQSAFMALGEIQKKYPEDVCLTPPGFSLDGIALETKNRQKIYDIADITWGLYGDIFNRLLDNLLP